MKHREQLADIIVRRIHALGSTAIATLGDHGYCGHSDHSAAHHAALDAQATLAKDGIILPVLALNNDHEGDVVVPVNRERKLAALALHETQFGFLRDTPELPESHQIYEPLLRAETYDIY